MSTRLPTPDDIPACVALRGQTRENAISAERLASIGITAACWADDVKSGSGLAVEGAGYEAHLIGFQPVRVRAELELAPPGIQAELYRLCVQERFMGCGVGSALLRSAEALAFRRGAPVLWLTPWVHNHRARRFYAARGCEDCGSTLFRVEGEAHENRVVARALPAQNAAGPLVGLRAST